MNLKKHKIIIRNIYDMLCYCIEEFENMDYFDIDNEDISGTHDLLAALLISAFEHLNKYGYIRRYVEKEIITDKPYGDIDIQESMELGTYGEGRLACRVNVLDINNKYNQIIKAANNILIKTNNAITDKINKNLLTKLYMIDNQLYDVDSLDVTNKSIDSIKDVPEWYKPMFAVCKLIINDWLAFDEEGNCRLLELNDDNRVCHIFEKFARRYYRNKLINCEVTKPTLYGDRDNSENSGEGELFRRTLDILILNKAEHRTSIYDAKYAKDVNSKKNEYENQVMTQAMLYNNKYYHLGHTLAVSLLFAVDTATTVKYVTYLSQQNCRFYKSYVNLNQSFEGIKKDLDMIYDKVI